MPSIVRKFQALREAQTALFKLREALDLAMERADSSVGSLSQVSQDMPLAPVAIEREEATKAVRKAYETLIDGPRSHYEAERDRLTEELEEECERRGLDFGLTKNALGTAAEHRRKVREAIAHATTFNWRDRPGRHTSSSSPLYGMTSDLRFYRKYMHFALAPLPGKQAAAKQEAA